MECLTNSMMRESGMGDSFFTVMIERRWRVASRKLNLEARPAGLEEDVMLRERAFWCLVSSS